MADCSSCYGRKRRVACSITGESEKRGRSVPTWEKRFCWEVGSLPWKRFEKAKKSINEFHTVLQWNDSAGEEAFNKAKLRYWLKIHGLPCRIPLPSPNICIDKIEWNPKSNLSELVQCLDEASTMEEEEEEEEKVKTCFEVPLDQIMPTGWDCDYGEVFDRRNRLFTGMVVGE